MEYNIIYYTKWNFIKTKTIEKRELQIQKRFRIHKIKIANQILIMKKNKHKTNLKICY